LKNLKTNRTLWTITTLFTLSAAILGVLYPGLYSKVVTSNLILGAYAQDLLTIIVSIALLVLVFFTKRNDFKKQAVILGLIGSFWYLYGIFTIEQAYNPAYYLYLAIFSLSFWTIAYSLVSLDTEIVTSLSVPRTIRMISAGFSLAIAVLFNFLWISALYPLVLTGTKIESLYSIYILDLCFVMPAFVITAALLLRKRGLGILMTPSMYILGIFVIFPLGLGELAKPYFGLAADNTSMIMSFVFSALFLIFAALNLRYMKWVKSRS
jgi:hypothetical protein